MRRRPQGQIAIAFVAAAALVAAAGATAALAQQTYTVQSGDTLYRIAQQHGTTVPAIAEANEIHDVNRISVGQVLEIPGAPGNGTYTVRAGDTLFRIAQQQGTTVAAIANANNIADVNRIEVGQVLTIPGATEGAGEPRTYTVQSGDTLYRIAQEHGTTVDAMVVTNDLADPNRISVGQVLVIPSDEGMPALTQSCEGPRWTVDYPEGWHTNTGEVAEEPCRWFNGEEFAVEPATELFTDVMISVAGGTFDEARARLDGEFSELLSEEETTVDGRPAVRAETVTTEELLVPAGTEVYRYLIDVDGETTVEVITYDSDGRDYERNREVVDAMIETLEVQ